MAKLNVNIGQSVNDKTGDTLRSAFDKINQNFTELYTLTGGTSTALIELAQDYAAPMFNHASHVNITATYDDVNNKILLTGATASSLVNGSHTVSLSSAGLTAFPAISNESLFIQASELGSANASVGISAKDNVIVTANILSTAKQWIFGTDGTLTLPPTPTGIINANQIVATRIYRATTSNDATAIINAKTDWIGSETQWEDARNNDAITYPSRSWAGLPSWQAYPLVLAYNGPNQPSGPFAQIVTAARNQYLTFKGLESNIDIVSGNKVFSFENTGNITVPGGLNLSGNIKFADDTVQTTAWTNSIAWANVTSKPTIPTSFTNIVNGSKTVSLGTDGTLTLPAPPAQLYNVDQIATVKLYRAANSTNETDIAAAKDTWIAVEQVWTLIVNQDFQQSGYTWPWTGKPSWEGYPLLMNYNSSGTPVPGVTPPSSSLAPAGNSAVQAYLAYKQLLSSIDIVSGNKTFSFENTGALRVPGVITKDNSLILVSSGVSGVLPNDFSASVTVGGQYGRVYIRTNDGATGSNRTWTFGTDGGLTFPDSTVQTTAFTGSTANTGNVGFRNDTIYDLAGLAINNSNTSTASTAGISIPANGSGVLSITNNAKTWGFDTNGNLTFTNGEQIKTNFLGGGIELYRTADNTIGVYTTGAEIKTFATGGAKHTWTFGTNGWLNLPNNGVVQANTLVALSSFNDTNNIARVTCQSIADVPQVNLRTITSTGAQTDWIFSSAGTLTLPLGNSSIIGNSSIQSVVEGGFQSSITLNPYRVLSQTAVPGTQSYSSSGDFVSAIWSDTGYGGNFIAFNTLESYVVNFINTYLSRVSNVTVQINGTGAEYPYSNFNGTDEIYLTGMPPSSPTAVTSIRFSYQRISKVHIEPDDGVFDIVSQPGQDIDIEAGDDLRVLANDLLDITAGNRLQLRSGIGSASITTNHEVPNATPQVWRFNTDGTTQFPNNTIKTPSSLLIETPSGGIPVGISNYSGGGGWNSPPYNNLATTGGTGTGLTVNVSSADGGYINITAITIHTPGTGYTNGDVITINNENNISATFTISTLNTWSLGTNGRTTFPNGTVPEHSYGAAGDKEGMVVFSDPYIYYCKQDYVNNTTDIWVRVAWTGTNW